MVSRVTAFWERLESFGDAPAILSGGTTITHAGLARRADAAAVALRARLGAGCPRPLLLIEAGNAPEPIECYLGALRAGWPVILSEAGDAARTEALAAVYRPDARFVLRDGAWSFELAEGDPAPLHADLAVMLSTSGSTGSAKIVRLSRDNIASNADAIAEYLGLGPGDRAATALPWHYSYGMSVLHSQLAAGGSLALTDRSVIDPEFWDLVRTDMVTVLSLVPTQFDLLEARGFRQPESPSLRVVTQAGGRLDPALARRHAENSRREGWSFFVMYGQTEAAPRIAYVPADAPLSAYDTIGRAIPGGTLSILDAAGAPVRDPGVEGELVYRGANVMMGYATARGDLALGAETGALRTGDIATFTPEGFVRIVGRSARFVKLHGLRIGLDDLEARLRARGLAASCTGTDAGLAVFVTGDADCAALREEIARDLKVAPRLVRVEPIAAIPLLASGKVDYRALAALASSATAGSPAANDVERILCRALHVEALEPCRSFRDYGGDSLAYLEVELALSEAGIPVADGWEDRPLGRLVEGAGSAAPAPARRSVPLDLILRIAAIVAVIANHSTTWSVSGGAYFLLVLSGYSVARFQSPTLFAGEPLRAIGVALGRILIWYFAMIATIHVLWTPVGPRWWLLLGNYDGGATGDTKVLFYWFVSALTQVVLFLCLPFFFAPVRNAVRRAPLVAGLLCLGVVAAVFEAAAILDLLPPERHRHTIGALELAMVGWCAFFAETLWRRLLVSAVVLVLVGWHWNGTLPTAQAFIALGALSLVFSFRLSLRRSVAEMVGLVGSLTLMLYLVHPFVLAIVQRVGIGMVDPNWPDWALFGATAAASVPIALLATRLERTLLRPAADRLAGRLTRIRVPRPGSETGG